MRAVASVYRAVVVTGRWLMVAGWLALAIALPPASPTSGGAIGADVGTLLPPESAAVAAQERSLEKFAVPVVSQAAVVVHDPAGLTILTQADVALWALTFVQAADEGRIAPGPGQIIGAVPVPSVTPEIAVTYLYFSPGTSSEQVVALATVYADHFSNQASVQTWVTGITPAQLAQRGYLSSSLGGFEIATLALVAVVVALVFRSFTAPIAVLAVAGLGYVVALRLLRILADRLGFALPDDLQPLLAALLIGVVTDYCVLFLFACRDHLVRGAHRHVSAARAAMSEGPIVAVAGLTVAGGTAALLAANFPPFKAFGPAMAITVLVGLAISLTLVPALVAILGRWLFLPWRPDRWAARLRRRTTRRAGLLMRIVLNRAGAALAALLAVAVLVIAAAPIRDIRLDVSFTSPLPADDPVREGTDLLAGYGVTGITAPTEVLVEGPDVTAQRRSARAPPGLDRRRARSRGSRRTGPESAAGRVRGRAVPRRHDGAAHRRLRGRPARRRGDRGPRVARLATAGPRRRRRPPDRHHQRGGPDRHRGRARRDHPAEPSDHRARRRWRSSWPS